MQTEDDLAAVQYANEFVAWRLIVVYLQELYGAKTMLVLMHEIQRCNRDLAERTSGSLRCLHPLERLSASPLTTRIKRSAAPARDPARDRLWLPGVVGRRGRLVG